MNYKIILCVLFIILSVTLLFAENSFEIVITNFTEDSNLKAAGAEIGDLLINYNDIKVTSINQLGELKIKVMSDHVRVMLQRDGKNIKVSIPTGRLGIYLQEFSKDHKFDRNAVIIEGIGKLDWGIGMENSFLAAVTRIEEKFGDDINYLDLVGLSGYGFRTHIFDGLCPSSPDATVGWDCGSYILGKLGYKFQYYFLKKDEGGLAATTDIGAVSEDEMIMIIKKNIDSGWPVIAIDLIEIPEWGIITGYQKDGKELICRTYYDKTRGYDIASKMPWIIMTIEGKEDADLSGLYRESLTVARKLYNTPEFNKYFSGIRGLKEWIKLLENEEFFNNLKEKKLQEVKHANWWIYYSLIDAKVIAVKYLENNKDKFGLKVKIIDRLISLYTKQVELLLIGSDFVPDTREVDINAVWTMETLQNQADILKKIVKLERKVNLILLTL